MKFLSEPKLHIQENRWELVTDSIEKYRRDNHEIYKHSIFLFSPDLHRKLEFENKGGWEYYDQSCFKLERFNFWAVRDNKKLLPPNSFVELEELPIYD